MIVTALPLVAFLVLDAILVSPILGRDALLTEAAEWSCKQIGGHYHDGTTDDGLGGKWPRVFVPSGGTGREARDMAAEVPLCAIQ